MLAVVQRARRAEVKVEGERVAKISRGLVAFVGVEVDDEEAEADYLAAKLRGLRVFPDSEGRMNLCLGDLGLEVLLVSNFTVVADCRKGRRPSFDRAAAPEVAEPILRRLGGLLEEHGIIVKWGRFGKIMDVIVENDGPVTVLIDSRKRV